MRKVLLFCFFAFSLAHADSFQLNVSPVNPWVYELGLFPPVFQVVDPTSLPSSGVAAFTYSIDPSTKIASLVFEVFLDQNGGIPAWRPGDLVTDYFPGFFTSRDNQGNFIITGNPVGYALTSLFPDPSSVPNPVTAFGDSIVAWGAGSLITFATIHPDGSATVSFTGYANGINGEVPEPSSLLLFGSGLGILLTHLRRPKCSGARF